VLLFTEAGLTGHSFAEQILGTEARLKVILIAGLNSDFMSGERSKVGT
jgi:hypothetical protein